MSQKGQYCDLGEGGSVVYAFGRDNRIINHGYGKTVDRPEMAGVVKRVLDEIGIQIYGIDNALQKEFGGITNISEHPYPRPETGEIVCSILVRDLDMSINESVLSKISSGFIPEYGECDFCPVQTRVIRPNGITTCDSTSCIEKRNNELDKAISEKLGYESLQEFRDKDPLSK